MLTACMGTLALTQAVGVTDHPGLFVLQALTPFLLAPALPLAVLALVAGRYPMAFVNAAIGTALVVLVAPMALVGSPAAAAPDAARATVAHANSYYRTDDPERAAVTLLALDADVLAITELSSQFATAFDAAGGDDRYPFTAVRAPGDRNGIALFSRHPIIDHEIAPIGQAMAIDADILIEGTPVRIVVVHPLPGIDRAAVDTWAEDLRAIDAAVDPDPATILLGDFNATRWHPAFRDLLDEGWVDAHEATGRGWTMSWPTDAAGPPFVRIDHALLGRDVVAERVRDLDVPGSDHRAFVVEAAFPTASGTSGTSGAAP